MGFLVPKPTPVSTYQQQMQQNVPPPPNTPIVAKYGDSTGPTPQSRSLASYISTSPQGLTRRASTQKSSLLGG